MTPEATPPPGPTAGRGISARQQRGGLIALAVGFVALAALLGLVRSGGPVAAPASATPTTRYAPDPTIPPEARTHVYVSGQRPSGVYASNARSQDPATKATTINPFTVKVETSLATDPDVVAATIFATLDDPRGWASYGKNAFRLVTTESTDQLAFLLASPGTVDALCGASMTRGRWDCVTGNTVVLNSDRWFYMTPTYDSLADYRAYMVNRQVGFWLGQTSTRCRSENRHAPVMSNQNESLRGCLANPWPRFGGALPAAVSPSPAPGP